MKDAVRRELMAKTKDALDANDWNAVVHLWYPWVEQGDADAEFQLAYSYLWCTSCDDQTTCEQMKELLRQAAAKNHPDAIWFSAMRERSLHESSPEFQRELLRAAQLGSVHAQRELGVMYATGDWSGPKDLAEAARWYRLAAERGEAESQYDLGFMLLLGEGGPKNVDEGLQWLERAAAQGNSAAFKLLADCYETGLYGVPVNVPKGQLWRGKLEEHERLNPPPPFRQYSIDGGASQSSLECLLDIEGVIGFGFRSGDQRFHVSYDPASITPDQLDERVRAKLSALPGPPA